jgi:putative peptidoglycan lipid II flippase
VGALMLPAIFGSSVAQINVVFDNIIASFLQAGSVSWLYYADRLMEFPLGVFGIALATVILPGLSAQHATHSREAFSATLDHALRLVLLIGVPAAAGLVVLATPLIATIFFGGEFGTRDVGMASVALGAYAAGLLGFIFVKVLAPGYFSRQDTRTPVRIGVIALAANMVMNIVFVLLLLRSGFAGPHAGLALATSLAAFLNAGLLYRGLLREGVYWRGPGWGALLLRVGLACAGMVALLFWLRGLPGDWLALEMWPRIAWLGVAVIAGVGSYFLLLFGSGFRPSQLHGKSPGPSL